MKSLVLLLAPWLCLAAEKADRPNFHDPVELERIIADAVHLQAVKKADGDWQFFKPHEFAPYQGSGWGVVFHENKKVRILAQFANGKVNGFSFSCYPSGQAMAGKRHLRSVGWSAPPTPDPHGT